MDRDAWQATQSELERTEGLILAYIYIYVYIYIYIYTYIYVYIYTHTHTHTNYFAVHWKLTQSLL